MDAKRFIEVKKAEENSKRRKSSKGNYVVSDDCTHVQSDLKCIKCGQCGRKFQDGVLK